MSDPMSRNPSATWSGDLAQTARVSAFLTKVYGWMFVGLAITAAVAYAVASTPALVNALIGNQILFIVVLLAPLGFVWALSAKVDSLSPRSAAILFTSYAALNGITFSVVLLHYTSTSVASTFVTAAGTFGALALFGTVTKRNLEGVGQFAMMGLIGLIIAMVVSFFFHSDTMSLVISLVGVLVFTCLTVYDAQKMKAMALAVPDARLGAYSIVGALNLYLDFVNLFLFLLRFMGNRRN